LVDKYPSFYELVLANFDWMANGNGEGLVLISPTSSNCFVSKWKIGNEASANNISCLENILKEIQDDTNFSLFGEDTERATKMVNMMLEVAKSKKLSGVEPKAVQKKAPFVKSGPIQLESAVVELYQNALKSAQTKFDHEDTFFVKNMKGVEEYSNLLSKECLSDIKIDQSDVDKMKQHNEIIFGMLKEMFIQYKKKSTK